MSMTVTAPTQEEALAAFLEKLPEPSRIAARSLAHAWMGGGGNLAVGNIAIRLLGETAGQPPFTAGTLHAPHGREQTPRLELCRVILESHGVTNDAWTHWSDELSELQAIGFDPTAKFPTLLLDTQLTPVEMVRLVNALRDLAAMIRSGTTA